MHGPQAAGGTDPTYLAALAAHPAAIAYLLRKLSPVFTSKEGYPKLEGDAYPGQKRESKQNYKGQERGRGNGRGRG